MTLRDCIFDKLNNEYDCFLNKDDYRYLLRGYATYIRYPVSKIKNTTEVTTINDFIIYIFSNSEIAFLGCGTKRKYFTGKEAKKDLKIKKKKYKHLKSAYFCSNCNHWHLTSREKIIRKLHKQVIPIRS